MLKGTSVRKWAKLKKGILAVHFSKEKGRWPFDKKATLKNWKHNQYLMFSSYTVSFLTSGKISLASDTIFLKQKKSISDNQSCFCVEKSKTVFLSEKGRESITTFVYDGFG